MNSAHKHTAHTKASKVCAKNINLMRTKHVSFAFNFGVRKCDVSGSKNKTKEKNVFKVHSQAAHAENKIKINLKKSKNLFRCPLWISMRLSNSPRCDFLFYFDKFLPFFPQWHCVSRYCSILCVCVDCCRVGFHNHDAVHNDKVKYAQKEQKKNHFSVIVVVETNGPCSTHTEQTETKVENQKWE